MHEEGLGIDFGDVIAGSRVSTDPRGIEIESNYLAVNRFLRVLPVENAFASIRILSQERFGNRMWVISKWRPAVQDKCRIWLRHHNFSEITGIPPERILFCAHRGEKAQMARDLGITDFVDNKLEVLAPMIGTVPNLFLFRPSPLEVLQYASSLRHVCEVKEWSDIVRSILARANP